MHEMIFYSKTTTKLLKKLCRTLWHIDIIQIEYQKNIVCIMQILIHPNTT